MWDSLHHTNPYLWAVWYCRSPYSQNLLTELRWFIQFWSTPRTICAKEDRRLISLLLLCADDLGKFGHQCSSNVAGKEVCPKWKICHCRMERKRKRTRSSALLVTERAGSALCSTSEYIHVHVNTTHNNWHLSKAKVQPVRGLCPMHTLDLTTMYLVCTNVHVLVLPRSDEWASLTLFKILVNTKTEKRPTCTCIYNKMRPVDIQSMPYLCTHVHGYMYKYMYAFYFRVLFRLISDKSE